MLLERGFLARVRAMNGKVSNRSGHHAESKCLPALQLITALSAVSALSHRSKSNTYTQTLTHTKTTSNGKPGG